MPSLGYMGLKSAEHWHEVFNNGGLRKGLEAWSVGVPLFSPALAPPGQILSPLPTPWMKLDRDHLQTPTRPASKSPSVSSLQ